MIIKILHSILFIMFTYMLYLKYNTKLEIKYKYLILFLIYTIMLFIINTIYTNLSNKLLLVLLLFSFSQILIHFLKNMINIQNLNGNLVFKENYFEIKHLIFDKIFIILILIYQLLLIWVPAVFSNMINEWGYCTNPAVRSLPPSSTKCSIKNKTFLKSSMLCEVSRLRTGSNCPHSWSDCSDMRNDSADLQSVPAKLSKLNSQPNITKLRRFSKCGC